MHRGDRERGGLPIRRGPEHDDGVAFEVDLLEQPTEELVSTTERVASDLGASIRRGDVLVGVRPNEVGRLDEHDRPDRATAR